MAVGFDLLAIFLTYFILALTLKIPKRSDTYGISVVGGQSQASYTVAAHIS